jgi:membrane protein
LRLAAAFIAGAAAPALARSAAERLSRRLLEAQPNADKHATSPLRISRRGWLAVLGHTIGEFSQDGIPRVAAGATFFALLALFPALAAFVSLYGLIADVGAAQRQILSLSGVLPGGAVSVVGQQLTRLAATSHRNLGLAFAVSLIASIASSNAGVKAVIDGLNIAYEEREKRGFLKLNAISLAFTLGAIVFSVVAIASIIAVPGLLRWLGLGARPGLTLLRWPCLLVVVSMLFSLLYRYGPSREHARWRWVTPGGLVAALGWLVMSVLFSWYVANFGHYDRTYGSLGAVIGFMTWIWMSLIIVLLGAELNSELELQTFVDTTTGPPMPAGHRGAYVADHKTGADPAAAPVRSRAPKIR